MERVSGWHYYTKMILYSADLRKVGLYKLRVGCTVNIEIGKSNSKKSQPAYYNETVRDANNRRPDSWLQCAAAALLLR